jgi:hypothetical protein
MNPRIGDMRRAREMRELTRKRPAERPRPERHEENNADRQQQGHEQG